MTENEIRSDIKWQLLQMAKRPGLWGSPKYYEASRLATIAVWDAIFNCSQRESASPLELWDKECRRLHGSNVGTLADNTTPINFDEVGWQAVFDFVIYEMQGLFKDVVILQALPEPWSNRVSDLFMDVSKFRPKRLSPDQLEALLWQIGFLWHNYAIKNKALAQEHVSSSEVPSPPNDSVHGKDNWVERYQSRLRKLLVNPENDVQFNSLASIAMSGQKHLPVTSNAEIPNFNDQLQIVASRMTPIEDAVVGK